MDSSSEKVVLTSVVKEEDSARTVSTVATRPKSSTPASRSTPTSSRCPNPIELLSDFRTEKVNVDMELAQFKVKRKVSDLWEDSDTLVLIFPQEASSREDFENIQAEVFKLIFPHDDVAFTAMGYYGACKEYMRKAFELCQMSLFLERERAAQGQEYGRMRLQLVEKDETIQRLGEIDLEQRDLVEQIK